MLLATVVSAVTSAVSKALVADYSTNQIIFFRCAFALAITASWAHYRGWSISLTSPHWPAHIFRGALNIISLALYIWPMAYLPLADVIALSFTLPLFATALSIPILGEWVSLRAWAALIAGFSGVLIILRPSLGSEQLIFQLAVVVGALLWALSIILTRQLTATESSTKIVLYLMIVGTTTTGLALPFQWATPTGFDLALLSAVGVGYALIQLLTTEAYRRAASSSVSSYFYATLLWTTIIGYFVWGEVPDYYVIVGSAILLFSGIYLAVQMTYRVPRPIIPDKPAI